MSRHSRASHVALFLVILAVTTAARADVLYSNGAPNGTIGGWEINNGVQIEDSFMLSSTSTLTTVTFGNNLYLGDSASSVQWTILDFAGSLTPACATCSGIAPLTPVGTFPELDATIYTGVDQEFSLPNPSLPAGTYWLELQNEVVTNNDPAYWDIDGGTSSMWESVTDSAPSCGGRPSSACSSAFTIFGTPTVSAVPEPSSLALLAGGLTFVAAKVRRRYHSR